MNCEGNGPNGYLWSQVIPFRKATRFGILDARATQATRSISRTTHILVECFLLLI